MSTRTPRRAARVAVTEPGGAVFLFRYDQRGGQHPERLGVRPEGPPAEPVELGYIPGPAPR